MVAGAVACKINLYESCTHPSFPLTEQLHGRKGDKILSPEACFNTSSNHQLMVTPSDIPRLLFHNAGVIVDDGLYATPIPFVI
jgi:hypothetical protein